MGGRRSAERKEVWRRGETEKRGRNKIIARGMVDEELEFPSKTVNEFVKSDNEIDTIKTKIYYLTFNSG